MVALLELWQPILLSAVFVFVLSSVLHMVLQLHSKDFKKLPDEEGLMAAIKAAGVQPGSYVFPLAGSMKEMGTPEMIEKMNQGPVGHMTVLPDGPPAMGRSLVQWFVLSIVVGLFTGYIGSFSLADGAAFMPVFRLTGTIAVLVYGITNVTDSIWKGAAWSTTGRFIFDGILYGLATGATFGWLWP